MDECSPAGPICGSSSFSSVFVQAGDPSIRNHGLEHHSNRRSESHTVFDAFLWTKCLLEVRPALWTTMSDNVALLHFFKLRFFFF